MDTGDRHAGDAPIGIDDPDKRGLPVTLAYQVVPISYLGGIGGAQVDLVELPITFATLTSLNPSSVTP